MGSITSYSKQIVVFFIALTIFIRPTFASTVGGWSMGNPIAHGASTIYEGSKNVIINGADYVKRGAATITPTAANVAKTLGKGVAGVAVSVAVDQLLGAVDWVLDPANNQITYRPDASPTQPNPNIPKFWLIQDPYINPSQIGFSNVAAACAFLVGKKLWSSSPIVTSVEADESSCTAYNNGSLFGSLTVRYVANPAYDPAKEEEKKTLPLPSIASQVISNAEAGDTNAQVATVAAAADIVAEAETDSVKARPIAQQLEASATTKPADEAAAAAANTAIGTQTQNPTNPSITDLALEFPAFCGWAPTVCEFAQTAIQSIADAKAEYADKPQENTDTELEIPDLEQDIEVDSDISFGGSCPAPLTSQVNFMGINETIEFSFENVCEIAEFIKPVVISVSAFSAALIVAGIRTEDD